MRIKDVGKLRALAVLAVCLFVTVAESINLGQRSLWYDEAYSAAWTRLSWTTLWPQIHAKEPFLLTYYVLLKVWETFGQSEVALRAFSVVFSVATLPLVYWLGRRCFNPTTGFVAMIFLAANPVFYYYAREARASSLLIFFSVAASAAFLHALDARTARAWALYVLVSALGIYCQLFLIFTLCAHALFTLVNWRTTPYRAACGSFLIVAALVAPLFVLSFTTGIALHSWIQRPTIGNLFSSLFAVTGGSIAFALDAIIFAVVFAVRRPRGWHTPPRGFVQFLLLWLFVPIVIVFAVSLRHPIYDSRYLVGVIPAGSVLIANAVTQLPKWCWFLVVLMLAASLRGLVLQKDGDVQDWRQAVATILSEARPGDAVVIYPATGFVAYEYYAGSASQPILLPKPLPEHLDNLQEFPSQRFLTTLTAHPGVWIVFAPLTFERNPDADPLLARFEQAMQRRFALIERSRFHGITLLRYERKERLGVRCTIRRACDEILRARPFATVAAEGPGNAAYREDVAGWCRFPWFHRAS